VFFFEKSLDCYVAVDWYEENVHVH
jgi:hypothetical protein